MAAMDGVLSTAVSFSAANLGTDVCCVPHAAGLLVSIRYLSDVFAGPPRGAGPAVTRSERSAPSGDSRRRSAPAGSAVGLLRGQVGQHRPRDLLIAQVGAGAAPRGGDPGEQGGPGPAGP